MKLHSLKPAKGSIKDRKRIGRGQGSGRGGTSTKGHKGGQSRSGYEFKPYFEGGQMPLTRRLPKFGFKNVGRVEYQIVNLDALQKALENNSVSEVNPQLLKELGLISSLAKPVKILGNSDFTLAITITANKFSKGALETIEQAKGKAIIIE